MPLTSLRPIPPTPIQATLSLSLGATQPRPSTCRGTMVKTVAVATSPTKVRRVIRLRAMITPLCSRSGRRGCPPGPEQKREQHENHERHRGRIHPDAVPVVRDGAVGSRAGEGTDNPAGDPGAN